MTTVADVHGDRSKSNRCKFVDCEKESQFGSVVDGLMLYCVKHKAADHQNLKKRRCISCTKFASFGSTSDTRPLYCKDHVPNDGIVYKNIRRTTCRFKDCTNTASFGKGDAREQEYCANHGRHLPGYQPLYGLCEYENCERHAAFGLIGSLKRQFCSRHAPKDGLYKNLKHVICQTPLCQLVASYGEIGTTKKLHCAKHGKEMGMMNTQKKKCIADGCTISPSFAPTPTSLPQLCKKHVPKSGPKYYNVTIKQLCQYEPENDEPVCTISASYGPPTSRSPSDRIYCATHKPAGWIGCTMKFCEYVDDDDLQCNRAATCGHLFEPVKMCHKHKLRNMRTKNNPKCEVLIHGKKCVNRPLYTKLEKNYPQRCEDHKTDGDKNVIERPCKNCHLTWFILQGSDYCDYCDVGKSAGATRQYEKANEELLKAAGYKFRTDQTVDTECSRKRPDFVIENPPENNHSTIVEIDEEQHRSYPCVCEQNRMIELFQAFGGEKVTFIRFNPYPFHYMTDGKKQSPIETLRSTRLLSVIRGLSLHPLADPLTVIYLYYNGDAGTNDIINIDYEKHLLSFPENRHLGVVDDASHRQAETKNPIQSPHTQQVKRKSTITTKTTTTKTTITRKLLPTERKALIQLVTTTHDVTLSKPKAPSIVSATSSQEQYQPHLHGTLLQRPQAVQQSTKMIVLHKYNVSKKRCRDESGIVLESPSKLPRVDTTCCSRCFDPLSLEDNSSSGSGVHCRKCLVALNTRQAAARKHREQAKKHIKKLATTESKRERELQRPPDNMLFRCCCKQHDGDRIMTAGDYNFTAKLRTCQNESDAEPRFMLARSCRTCTKIATRKSMIKRAAKKTSDNEYMKAFVDDDDNDDV